MTDIIKVDDFDSFYIDLVHEYNALERKAIDFPYVNPVVETVADNDYRLIYGFNPFEEKITSSPDWIF